MARDYKFAMYCWQDQLGDENAIANIFVNGTQVATAVEITATSADTPQAVVFEVTGIDDPDPDGSVTADIKVVLTNEAYVDADNDRNIWINGLFAFPKKPDEADYEYPAGPTSRLPLTDASIADDTAIHAMLTVLPTDVQGSQIGASWWADEGAGSWTYIPVWGDSSDTGTTITLPLKILSA